VIEFAQIGTGIVRFLKDHYKYDESVIETLPEQALMDSICLAHDIGHPPFPRNIITHQVVRTQMQIIHVLDELNSPCA